MQVERTANIDKSKEMPNCVEAHIAGLVENYGISNTIVLEIP